MTTETWLPVVGWEGIYEVSSTGQVRRVLAGKGTRGPNFVLRPVPVSGGYLRVTLKYMGRVKQAAVHQLVLAAFVGPQRARNEVNHKDGDRTNNKLENLEYCSSRDNKLHAYKVLNRSKVSCRGAVNGNSKLTDDNVLDIRQRYAAGGISQQKLADEYGINQTLVGFIVRRVNWRHLA